MKRLVGIMLAMAFLVTRFAMPVQARTSSPTPVQAAGDQKKEEGKKKKKKGKKGEEKKEEKKDEKKGEKKDEGKKKKKG